MFNVIIYDFNHKEFIPYNIIPYFIDAYNEVVRKHSEYPDADYYEVPVTREDFVKFVNKEAMYQFWARTEYEAILVDWPCQQIEKKIDIYWQIKMNLNLIAEILMKELELL